METTRYLKDQENNTTYPYTRDFCVLDENGDPITDKLLPKTTEADAGKFLKVNDEGKVVPVAVPNAEDNTFGGE